MSCAFCRFYDVCVVRNTLEACGYRDENDQLRKSIVF